MGDPRYDETLQTLRGALGTRYEFERVLGEGAMGKVVLARDVTLDRLVAVKVISPVAAYERYLDVMRNADVTFQPQLKLARGRLRALRDAAATTLTS